MKIAIVTDIHFGARSDSPHFDKFFKKFYDEVFFPELKERKIKTVLCLGDVFDRRKYINFNTLKSCKEYFFDKLKPYNVTIIAGNHDVYFKNTNDVNSLSLLLQEYDNIEIISFPEEKVFGNTKTLLLPWICDDNEQTSFELLKSTSAKVCFGHLEISGFHMSKGQDQDLEHGLDQKIFKKFDLVASGHYHHRSSKNNIHYLGNPYEITWSDVDDPRGFHIWDTDTLELEFIQNPFRIFHKIYYDDESGFDLKKIDTTALEASYIKVIVENKKDFKLFDKLIDKLNSCNPIEIKIIEDFSEFENASKADSVDIKDTTKLLSEYVDEIETEMNREKIKKMLNSLYVEAQHTNSYVD